MKLQRFTTLSFLFTLLSSCLFSQGLNTTASKDDWEEINFEFNSPILTDGYPSLLRIAELLQKHPDYKVKIEGHADVIGSNRYNERLGQQRADTVKAFLVKYGAADGALTAASFGETQPKIAARDKEARFMNRRVMLTVTDAQGRVVSAGGVNETISALDQFMADQRKCCEEILKRLDKLDQIANLLQKMAGENDTLRKELADMRTAHNALDQYVKGLPKPLTASETSQIVDTRTSEQIERARMPRFSIIGLNAGADQSGELTFTGRGRYFMPFKEQFAVQMQGEYMYFRDRQEGQFDVGLVNRFASRAQAGFFGSVKHVNFSGRNPGRNIFTDDPSTIVGGNQQFGTGQIEGNGLLGQASFTLDYLFSRGKFGIFGSKGFLNDAVLNRTQLARNVFQEAYLRTIDQAGIAATIGLAGSTYMEGNVGYLKSRGNADRPGGTLRFVFPFSEKFAFTLEGGMNETLISRDNTGRVVAGFQMGNFMRPKDYLEGYNGTQHAVPVDVPRIRYEVLTRTIREGNDAPVADAGPDQIGVAAGTVTLNGTGSYDPENEALTYEWRQTSGPAVSISGMAASTATFTAAAGQSYGFRLTVRDPQGAQGTDTTAVTTTAAQQVQIVRFQASPERIRAGEQSTLQWQVLNAESVTISSLGTVASTGTRAVSPTATTTYTLTARNSGGELTATAVVTVEAQAAPQFQQCTVAPQNIVSGESATLSWATANAESVSISGIGAVDRSGTRVVTPTTTTAYNLTATGPGGTASCALNVTVTAQGTVPRIIGFAANPMTITAGQSSTLTWNVENSTSVEISGLGTVPATGTRAVSPTVTTTYTLTARNATGQTTGTAVVTVTPNPVGPAPTLAACVATPASSPAPGTAVSISYTAANATAISFAPAVSGATLTGPVRVTPTATTTYVITVTGSQNRTATCSVVVNVTPTPPPEPIIGGGGLIETINREVILDGSASTDPSGGALSYIWTPLGTGAAVLDQGQPRTRVQLGGQFGDYLFRLTVRNAAGQEASAVVTVRFKSINVD